MKCKFILVILYNICFHKYFIFIPLDLKALLLLSASHYTLLKCIKT